MVLHAIPLNGWMAGNFFELVVLSWGFAAMLTVYYVASSLIESFRDKEVTFKVPENIESTMMYIPRGVRLRSMFESLAAQHNTETRHVPSSIPIMAHVVPAPKGPYINMQPVTQVFRPTPSAIPAFLHIPSSRFPVQLPMQTTIIIVRSHVHHASWPKALGHTDTHVTAKEVPALN